MTPEMWLDLEPIHTVIITSQEFQTHFQVSAVGHGCRVLGRLGLPGADESDLPVKHTATKLLGAALCAG